MSQVPSFRFRPQRDVTQVALTGVATSIGGESTARSAHDLGYNVTLVVDAMTDRDAGKLPPLHFPTLEFPA